VISTRRAAWSAAAALLLVGVQFAAIRFAPTAGIVRVVLPLTIAAVPVALWPHRRHLGVWVMFVGLAANLAAILANGGLMPIERSSVVDAVGETRAARYEPGAWISGSKDVLVTPGHGRAVALGDSLVVHIGRGGFVASPGDLVVWTGLILLAGEASLGWQRRLRGSSAPESGSDAERAEGGAATSS
jgi:hypothetical protein